MSKKSFIGLFHEYQRSIARSHTGVPIDILPIYLLSSVLEDFTLLITDEFLKFNGKNEGFVNSCRRNLLETFDRLDSVYRLKPKILLCSDFMNSREYYKVFELIEKEVSGKGLEESILATVPQTRINLQSSKDYPIHEIACVEYLARKGFELKIGPVQEKPYDAVMQQLNLSISFAYLLDAYSLSRVADKVVHYVPKSRGASNGQRIFLGERERIVAEKLKQGCEESLRYFCKIACVSGHVLGREYKRLEEISQMYGKKLRSETIRLVIDNIVRPFNEAA